MTGKKILLTAAALCAALLVLSAKVDKDTIVFDPSLSADETALVSFTSGVHVLEYNGIGVEEAWYPNKRPRANRVSLPAGEASIRFNFDYNLQVDNYTVFQIRIDDVELRYDFEAKKRYIVGPYKKLQGLNLLTGLRYEYGLGIWTTNLSTGKVSSAAREPDTAVKIWKLGET
jgi:hypothetical protein